MARTHLKVRRRDSTRPRRGARRSEPEPRSGSAAVEHTEGDRDSIEKPSQMRDRVANSDRERATFSIAVDSRYPVFWY